MLRAFKLLRTTAFRLALVYLLLFLVSASALIAFIYWSTAGFMAAQTDQTIEAEVQGLSEQYELLGLPGLTAAIDDRKDVRGPALYLLLDPEGRILTGNLDALPAAPPGSGGWMDFSYARGSAERLARARILDVRGGYRMLVGRDIDERRQIEERIVGALYWSAGLTLALGFAGGLVMSRNVVRRLDAINKTSRDIIDGDLNRRVPLSGDGDEFDELAGNLNDMLDQIGSLMQGMTEVADNIAHDLRTPLNRLRSRLEVTLLRPATEIEYREALESAIMEADNLIGTFNSLLLIARAETGQARENFEDFDLRPLIADAVELYEPLAEAKRLALRMIPAQPAIVSGDRGLVAQAIANLIDNAIKYTPEGGQVTAALGGEGSEAIVEVRDTGPGIPDAEREHVLKRFVRLEESRNEPGSGLGLSLVAAVARLHDAKLTLRDAKPGLGVRLAFHRKAAG